MKAMIKDGRVHGLPAMQHFDSPFCNERPKGCELPSLLVVHNISLPRAAFATPYVHDLFMGMLDTQVHPSFISLKGLEVSSHFVIYRTGVIHQYVATTQRAWHAGLSAFRGRQGCNDFSIGIELEGCDELPFTWRQYARLATLTTVLMAHYPITMDSIVGHSDIAPGRKTDPGPCFDWPRYFRCIRQRTLSECSGSD